MLNEYPTYKNGEVNTIFEGLPQQEKKVIEQYIDYRAIKVTSKDKLSDIRRHITQLRHITEKDLNKLTLKDVRDFLTLLNKSERELAGKDDIKVNIKNFLKWKFKNWSKRFEDLKDIHTSSREKLINYKRINGNTLPTKEEIEIMLDAEPRLFWKTFFITLYESGMRPIELRLLKWSDVKFNVDGDVSEIAVYSTKTDKARTVYVNQATGYLKLLRDRTKTDTPLIFPSPYGKTKPISKPTVTQWLRRLSLTSIGREISPYFLRHKRAKELYIEQKGVSDEVAQKFLGHGKDMRTIYTRLSKEDVKEAMSKIVYNVDNVPEKTKHELEKRIDKYEKILNAVFTLQFNLVESEGERERLINLAKNTLPDFKPPELKKG